MKPVPSPQDQGRNVELINILKRLGSLKVEYPIELFAARRAAFLRQVEQQDRKWAGNGLFRHFENLKVIRAEYPVDLLAARRAAFIDQIEHCQRVENMEELHFEDPEDQEILKLFKNLKSAEAEYPPNLLAARRAAFRRQIALGGRISVLDALLASLRNLFAYRIKLPSMPTMNMMRTSLVVVVLALSAFVGSLLRVPVPFSSQVEIPQPGGLMVTETHDVAKVICRPGYLPPLCLVEPFDKSEDLTFQGNGLARPAVAKDTLPGYKGVHKAAYVNDGLYGPGTSWVSSSAYSWIKIDLGRPITINTIAFGKDRLSNSSGGDPGRFVIAVALSDNVYADGNSSNDYVEYTEVYDSKQAGFNGIISGRETIQAQFGPVTARYIKITFANPGTAVDEVEAFMIRSTILADHSTRKPKEGSPVVPRTSTPNPTKITVPTSTATFAPTSTPVPTDTLTPVPPTDTLVPTDTATPVPPTDTPVPPTDTPVPPPTDTPVPPPTDTPIPPPTDVPPAIDTPVPPPATQAPVMIPVNTPVDTPIPVQP